MKIILAAGGSGGHIFPSLALAAELEKRESCDVVFVSSKRRLDMSILGPSGFRCYFLSINPMPRGKNPFKYLIFLLKVLADTFSSARIILKERPDAVVGFGGYSSGTISLCARLFGKPLVIHEQNYFPGRANLILSGQSDLIALSFEDTVKYFPGSKGRTVWTGNPLRIDRLSKDREKAFARMGLSPGPVTLLVMGGSQGAASLNRIASRAVKMLGDKRKVQVIHLTGKADYEAISKYYEENDVPAKVFSFLDRMEDAYAVSDAAISRSGASAVFELAYYGMPMVLVPYPNPKNNQWSNAKLFAEKGAAVYKDEKDLTADDLACELERMISDPGRMNGMKEAASLLAVPDAARRLADAVMGIVKKNIR